MSLTHFSKRNLRNRTIGISAVDPFAAVGDPHWNSVVLAMRMDGSDGSTAFTDLKGHTITAYGNTAIKRSPMGAIAYFDGTGDYASTPDSADWSFGSGDFTVEAWVYLISTASIRVIVAQSQNASIGSEAFDLYVDSTGAVKATAYYSGTLLETTTTSTITVNTWNHIAYVRRGNVFTTYINGVSGVSATQTGVTINNSARTLTIGSFDGGGSVWRGFIDDLRITKGVARYTGNFTPTTVSFPDYVQGSQPVYGDPYWDYVTLLMHGESFNDEKGHLPTIYGNTAAATANSKFGGKCLRFDGTGDYVSFASSSDFSFGTGDFTLEFWLNCTRVGNVIDYASNTPNLYFDGSGNLIFYASGASRITTSAVVANTWQHVALCRIGTSTRLFIDGVQVGSTYTDTIDYSNTVHYIGSNNGGTGGLTGYIDDLRITKGFARYTGTFTPPVKAFEHAPLYQVSTTYDQPSIFASNVKLLMHFDGANGSTTFTDQTGKTVTAYGNAQISTAQSKFGGSSGYFDGTGDYLSTPDSADWDLYGDFTFEAWVNVYNITSTYPIAAQRTDGNNYFSFMIQDGSVRFVVVSGGSVVLSALTTATVSANTWAHVAYSRVSGVNKLFINGVLQALTTDTASNGAYAFSGTLSVGAREADGVYFQGYIDDLRITKGFARYVSNFTPPTAAFPNA